MRRSILCDIGATNIRLAICENNSLSCIANYKTSSYEDIHELFDEYIFTYSLHGQFESILLAAAGLIGADQVTLTLSQKVINKKKLYDSYNLNDVQFLNDVEAVALGIDSIPTNTIRKIRSSKKKRPIHKVICSIGSGLGVAYNLDNRTVVATEAGHIKLPYIPELHNKDTTKYFQSYGDILSGRGLVNLYNFYNSENIKNKIYSAKELTDSFDTIIHSEIEEMYSIFKNTLAEFCKTICLSSINVGEVLFAGGVIRSNYDVFIDERFLNMFSQDDLFPDYFNSLGFSVLTDDLSAFYGLMKLQNGKLKQ